MALVLWSHDVAFAQPAVENLPEGYIGAIAAPSVENLFSPLGRVLADGKAYAGKDADEKARAAQGGLFPFPTPERCLHGLVRRTCAICSGHTTRGTVPARVPRRLNVFDVILPLLQPPLGPAFDNVLAFGPGQKLYDFQIGGVKWLLEHRQALLADEMGLGKSIQAIVALRVLFRQGSVVSALVLSPKSVLTDWERKLRAWAPELRVQTIRGSRESREIQWLSQAHVHLATYESLRQDSESLDDHRFDAVVADEIQRIKNPGTGVAQAVRRLNPPIRWGLSGTPLENRPEDLIAIFAFLSRGLLRAEDALDSAVLRRKIEPHLLRRRKAEALKDLPKKAVGESWVELAETQRARYEEAESRGVLDLREKGEKITITHVFSLINHLKQICNFDPVTGESAKLDFVRQRLEHISEQGDKALIYSQFPNKTLVLVADALQEYGAQIYHGSLSERERDRVVEAFKANADRSVLLLSVKAGGLGLSLTEANYVFHMDLWWNPAAAMQAEDRTHRIGQKKSVFVQYIYTVGTIEERIWELLERKRHLFREIVDELSDVTLSKILTEEELFGMFGLERPKQAGVIRSAVVSSPRDASSHREQISTVERTLRKFIQKRLSRLSADWWITRVPTESRLRAEDRKRRNESSWPWLSPNPTAHVDYLDFSDYRKIVDRDDNWDEAFKEVLLHREIVVGKLAELEPIRNNLAHHRDLSTDEQQVLALNVDHLMKLVREEVEP